MNIKCLLLITTFHFLLVDASSQDLSNTKVDGYKGIWFELNQKYEYGDKYSGALGTYTAKHAPLAIYADKVNKTYFVYGGTTAEDKRHLLCMIGEYDHDSGMISKPTVVHDKLGIDDPHDNPSMMIDDNGFIWVFVSGRGSKRPGFKYRSNNPYQIDSFTRIREEEMTYPQPWNTEYGAFHFFTKYTGVRQLYFETSVNGENWTEDQLLAAIPVDNGQKSGHYQVSNSYNNRVVGTFFNRHPKGNVDQRTDLYYVQSSDFGLTWKTVEEEVLQLPILTLESPSRAVDYAALQKNIYLKDMGFDKEGQPACLYIRSNGHEPGPGSGPYEWCVTRWDGHGWRTSVITESDHNYDMGSLYLSDDEWLVVGPTELGPQPWGVGGEIAIWNSKDQGNIWKRTKIITEKSEQSHSYIRRPLHFKAPFSFFWADGNSHDFSKSSLYFGSFQGEVWQLPYEMKSDFEKPVKLK